MRCTRRSRCTRPTAAWCPNSPRATTCGASCRSAARCWPAPGARIGDLGAVAYTEGPGLAGALLAGAAFARSLAQALGVPAIGIHHLEGHLLSPLLSSRAPAFPFVALLVSGGHTQLMRVHEVGRYELLGETQDDAAGEAFDKTAKLLGLGYPGRAGAFAARRIRQARALQAAAADDRQRRSGIQFFRPEDRRSDVD